MAVESRVKDYLNEHGIKQAFVADRAGINISYFNEKLNGRYKFSLEEYVKICDVLKVPHDTFTKEE